MPDDDSARAIARLDYDALTAEVAERTKHQIALVDRGLQALLFANGGALVALFTLLGGGHVHITTRPLWTAFALYAAGLVLTMLANLAAFLSQSFYAIVSQQQAWDAQRTMHGLPAEREEQVLRGHRRGQHAQYAGVASAALAMLAFLLGCALALLGVLPA